MRKIRIGNDIRLKLKIVPNELANQGVDQLDEFDQTNVKQLRCYLINTSYFRPKRDEDIEPKPFLRVGFPEFYHPTHNNINNAGFPSYHMRPANMCNYDRFEPDFHYFHWWPGYRGFGLHPEHFHDHCCHLQHGPKPKPSCCGFEPWGDPHIGHEHMPFGNCFDYVPMPPCAEPHHPFSQPYDIFMRPMEDHSHQNPYMPYYLADSQVLNEKNAITCFFPAVLQKMCGTYKLVVVLTVFEQGWGRHNLRTYTIDKGDIFELVDNETGESGLITVDIDSSGKRENVYESLYSECSDYVMASDSSMLIGQCDINGNDYNIYAILKDGSTVLYNPMDWHFTELTFTSSKPEVVTVDKDGTLHAQDINDIEDTAVITVSDIDNTYTFTYTVTVKYLDTIKIGFSETESIDNITANDSSMLSYRIGKGVYNINNDTNGKYLWIFSQRKIHYVKSLEDNGELAAELSSGFRVPMTNAVIKNGYFCYRSISPILAGGMKFKIKFA